MTAKNRYHEKPPQRVVITGGPGIGKTTVINLLNQGGYQIIPEAARIVIEREQQNNSDCLPWKNISKFQNTVSQLQFALENKLNKGLIFSPVFQI